MHQGTRSRNYTGHHPIPVSHVLDIQQHLLVESKIQSTSLSSTAIRSTESANSGHVAHCHAIGLHRIQIRIPEQPSSRTRYCKNGRDGLARLNVRLTSY